ncbi:MAG: hypothetical protein R2727_05930 [Bacteroidales bacterium]
MKIKIITIYSFPFVAFTYGPILYLYVFFMIHPHRKFNYLNLLHFIPFAVFCSFCNFQERSCFYRYPGFFMSDRFISLRIVYGASFFSSITTYSVLAFILISNHQKNLRNTVSFTSSVITLNWLKIISISFYVAYLIFSSWEG